MEPSGSDRDDGGESGDVLLRAAGTGSGEADFAADAVFAARVPAVDANAAEWRRGHAGGCAAERATGGDGGGRDTGSGAADRANGRCDQRTYGTEPGRGGARTRADRRAAAGSDSGGHSFAAAGTAAGYPGRGTATGGGKREYWGGASAVFPGPEPDGHGRTGQPDAGWFV